MPGRDDVALASMGIYVFSTEFLRTTAHRGCGGSRVGPRLRPQHHSASDQRRAACSPIRSRTSRRRRSVLARRRHGRCLLRREHGAHLREPRAQLVRRGLADLDVSAASAEREIHARRRGAARHRDQFDDRGRLHHFRRDGSRVAVVLERHGRRVRPTCTVRSSCRTSRSAAAAYIRERDRRRGLHHSARHARSARTATLDKAAFPRDGQRRRARHARHARSSCVAVPRLRRA